MTERLIRLIRILTLIQAKPGIMAKELAEKCETTDRTIYRDLELLSLTAPITNMGHGKGYVFIGNFSLYPLDWTEKEALSFSMLPKVFESFESLLPREFNSAYEKVMASYYKEKKQKLDLLRQVADIIQMGNPSYKEEQENFTFPIIQAILAKKTIKTVYHTQSRDEETERYIDPYYLVPREHRFYLIGYCHTAKDIRTFRVSRFRQVILTKDIFDMRDFNIKKYLKNTWSIERGDSNITIKVRFSSNIARYIKEEELFVKPTLTELENGDLLFEVTLNHDREFLNWVYQYGPDAEIIEPQKYRDRMKEMLSEWKELYK